MYLNVSYSFVLIHINIYMPIGSIHNYVINFPYNHFHTNAIYSYFLSGKMVPSKSMFLVEFWIV